MQDTQAVIQLHRILQAGTSVWPSQSELPFGLKMSWLIQAALLCRARETSIQSMRLMQSQSITSLTVQLFAYLGDLEPCATCVFILNGQHGIQYGLQ